jgi:hypothetical protein
MGQIDAARHGSVADGIVEDTQAVTVGSGATVGGKRSPAEGGEGSAEGGCPAKNKTAELSPSRKIQSSVPQKIEPVPQNLQADLIDENDLEDDFEDFAGSANWRVEQRFYTKKDGTVMLRWNYRSRKPVYINGQRKIAYKPGGSKVWQTSKKRKKSTR